MADIHAALTDPDQRVQWDTDIKKMCVTEAGPNVYNQYVQFKMPFLFKDRDFFEERDELIKEDMIKWVYFSVEGEKEAAHDRCNTLMGYTQIRKIEGRVLFE